MFVSAVGRCVQALEGEQVAAPLGNFGRVAGKEIKLGKAIPIKKIGKTKRAKKAMTSLQAQRIPCRFQDFLQDGLFPRQFSIANRIANEHVRLANQRVLE